MDDTANNEARLFIENESNGSHVNNSAEERCTLKVMWSNVKAGLGHSKVTICSPIGLVIIIIIVVVILIVLCAIIVPLTLKPGRPTNSTTGLRLPQEQITDRPAVIIKPGRPMEPIHFPLRRPDLRLSFSEKTQSLVFGEAGSYNITLKVVYDEEYCGSSPPSGDIHLRMERAGDNAQICDDFSDTFSSDKDGIWNVFGRISCTVKMQELGALRIRTDYRNCIRWSKSYINVEKVR